MSRTDDTRNNNASNSSSMMMDQDEESALLASLQASRQEQQSYEANVLREAERSLAPTLSGTGFPALDGLIVGGTGHASRRHVELPHIQKVLSQTRARQRRLETKQDEAASSGNNDSPNSNSNSLDLLHLKEQLLLQYLHTVACVPPDELPVRRNEALYWHKYQQRQQRQEQQQQTIDQLRQQPTDQRQQPPAAQRRRHRVAFAAAANNNYEHDNEHDNDPDAPKLPPARNGGARVSILKRQQQRQSTTMEDESGGKNDDATQRQRLKQLRRERQRRKALRRRAWSKKDQKEDASSAEEDEEEHEFQEEPAPKKARTTTEEEEEDADGQERDEQQPNDDNDTTRMIKDDDDNDQRSSEEDVKPAAAAAVADSTPPPPPTTTTSSSTTTTTATTHCPLCQEPIVCHNPDDDDDMDALLAAHMATCQEQDIRHNTRSSSLRRSRRQNYKEDDSDYEPDDEPDDEPEAEDVLDADDDEAADDDSQKQQRKRRRQPSIHNKKQKPSTKKRPRRSIAATPKTSGALDDLEEWVYEDRVDAWLDHGISNMVQMSELDSNNNTSDNDDDDDDDGNSGNRDLPQDYGNGLLVPAWVHDRLFGYQRDGLNVLWEWHRQEAGGILGDEMGLGKTVSISAFLGSMIACRKASSILLIVPATMLNHWLTELSVWAPGIRRILIHPSGEGDGISRTMTPKLLTSLDKWVKKSRKNRVNECIDQDDLDTMPAHSFCGTGYAIITTYEGVRRNPDPYMYHDFSYVVLDEAQKIRNPDADITVACKKIRTPHRIAMSGTPIMNDLKELWSLFDFVFPGRLGTLPAFEQEFADPIRKGGYANASPMQVQLAYRCALTLRDLINPFLLRRLKKDIKEVSRMPSKTEHVLFCRLSSQQRALYQAYLESDAVAKVVRGSANLLGAITMLRKICNHPDLVCDPSDNARERFIKSGFVDTGADLSDDEGEDEEEDIHDEDNLMERSGKLEVLGKILPLWKKQGHRVLIFCQWKKMLNIVQKLMLLKGWKFGRLDGNTNVASRQRLVDAFNTDESYFAMLCTTRTGGVGLNLTGASRVCLYSPDWNPQIDAQARERAWRFGQKKEVTVYRLITAGTVEEKIYQRQIFKTALSNKVLQDPRQRRLFSQKDLRDLFTLKHDGGSIGSGGDGITETVEMTKGDGAVDIDDPQELDDKTLKDVMKSKGLAGVFDHDFVETSASAKTATAREMEQEAKKVAAAAVKALEDSVGGGARRFGTTGAPRFGSGGGSSLFGNNTTQPQQRQGSQGVLNSLKQRNTAATGQVENLGEYTQLLKRIRDFVRRRRPRTDVILQEFSEIPTTDVAIFRRLLKSVAKLENDRWCLKQERS